MKRTIFFAVLLFLFCISAFGQSKNTTIYKTDQWANIEEKWMVFDITDKSTLEAE